jgi:hypothetical protein
VTPDDHVVDQRAGQPVQRAADALVVGALDLEDAVVVARRRSGAATVWLRVPLGP